MSSVLKSFFKKAEKKSQSASASSLSLDARLRGDGDDALRNDSSTHSRQSEDSQDSRKSLSLSLRKLSVSSMTDESSRPSSLSRTAGGGNINFAGLDMALLTIPDQGAASPSGGALGRSPSGSGKNTPTRRSSASTRAAAVVSNPAVEQPVQRVALLHRTLRETLAESECLEPFAPFAAHLVSVLPLTLSPQAIVQICVCVAQRVLEYLFADCRGSEKDLLLLSRRLHRLAGALVDADCALSPSRDNVRAVLRAALGEEHDAAQDEREKEQEQEQEEDMLHTATAQLLVSLALDVAKIASKQLPSSLGVPDLDARVSRALCEHDFNVDDVQILPVKTNFSSVIERSKAFYFDGINEH